MTWHGMGLSDIGLVRQSNQDAFAVHNHLGLWVIADGMGGHAGGDVASRIAVETITNFFEVLARDRWSASDEQDPAPIEALLHEAIISSNQAIRLAAGRDRKLAGMGTTVVILLIAQGPSPCATIAHVGDSRAYLWRDKSLSQLTRDHSAVEEYVRHGLITREQAVAHPHRHILSRALGIDARVLPDISMHRLAPDDLVLLCTDGLTKMLDDSQIAHLLLQAGSASEAICRRLLEEANARGGMDNTTVVVIKPGQA